MWVMTMEAWMNVLGVGSSWDNGVAGNFGSTAAVVCLHLVDLN